MRPTKYASFYLSSKSGRLAASFIKTGEAIICIVTTGSDSCEAFIYLIRYLNAYLKTPCIVLYQTKGNYQRYGDDGYLDIGR